MKKIALGCLVALLTLTGCKNNSETTDQNVADASRQELEDALADRDQLIALVNQINADMDSIRSIENIIAVTGSSEMTDRQEALRSNMSAIRDGLRQRRERLDELERRLNASNLSNNNLRQTIATLRSRIDAQDAEIAQLRQNLDQARQQIGDLDLAVDSLNRTVNDVTSARDSVSAEARRIENELNRCYYAIGTRSELRQYNIIETGFLRRTKLMEGDFDRSFFTTADKRTLTSIDLNSSRARVLTNQPEESYRIIDANGHKMLQITNPALFWSLSNYLVIQID